MVILPRALRGISARPSRHYNWTYDGDGNRACGPEGTYAANTANQLTRPGTYTYNPGGDLTAARGFSAAYNGIDRAKSITTNGPAVAMTYAGNSQTERVTVGATTQRNGLYAVKVLGWLRGKGDERGISRSSRPNG